MGGTRGSEDMGGADLLNGRHRFLVGSGRPAVLMLKNLTWGSAAYASCQQPLTWPQQTINGPCTEVSSAACSSYP